MSYPVPDAALAHHTILLGKTRAGKSSTMRGMVERLLDQERPIGIIDPKGDWWGLKSSADGKRAGYPVIIFGGEHADVPINAQSGAHVAELVASGNRPFIIDLGGWMVGERTRFFVDFASAFFRHSRGPRHLAIDEVHNFAPQGRVLDPDSGKMLHWANRLASEGAGKGITLISASQRPQKVHKDYVTSHETLIAMRVIHPLDRGAVKEWIDGCPDPEKGKEVMTSLASLERGQGWVWSPEAKFGPILIRFPMFKTYDSFAAPTSDRIEKLKGWASVDLEDVRSKLSTAVEEAKANDPRALKAEIARLGRELAAAQKDAPAPAWPDQRELVQSLAAELAETSAVLERLRAGATELQRRQDAALSALQGERIEIPAAAPPQRRAAPTPALVQRQPGRIVEHHPSPSSAQIRASSAPRQAPGPAVQRGAKLPPGEQAVLIAAVQYGGVDRDQLSVLTGYKRSSRDAYIARLRDKGLVEVSGQTIRPLDGAAEALGADYEPLPLGEELQQYWMQRLPPGEAAILGALIEMHPAAVSRSELDDRTGYKRSSRDAYIQRLKARRLVDVSGSEVAASGTLFA